MSLFPEPTTAEQVASLDKLRREAQGKAHIARRARDREAAFYWLNEMVRLDKIRLRVVSDSQLSLLTKV